MTRNTIVNKILLLIIVVAMCACAGSSEIISMSSRNLSKGESMIIGSFSLNPNVMPLCHENVDTIAQTSQRVFGNYNLPLNPVLSVNYMYGFTDFYETGFGADVSLPGFTLIMNNKIGFSDFINHKVEKKMGFSYYNKASFTRGTTSFPASFDPYKMGHFEIGNYFIIGFFIKDYELTFTPHIDFNLLMSKGVEPYSIRDGEVIEACETEYSDNSLMSTITNKNLHFTNYGLNVALRTKSNFIYELGFQYIDAKTDFFTPLKYSNYQFSLGISYCFKVKSSR